MKLTEAALIKIFQTMDNDRTYILDRKTGEVVSMSVSSSSPRELRLMSERIAADKGRYIPLPKRPPAENFRDMEEFKETLTDVKLKQRLSDALISGRNAAKCFRDQLRGRNFETEKWNEFQKKKMREFAIDFIRSNGLKL